MSEPLTPMDHDEIVRYARGVVTNEYMLADLNDMDWRASLALILSGLDVPPNASMLFLVPVAAHQNGRWLNGRVPGCTFLAVMVPIECVEPLLTQCREFWLALNPGAEP